MPFLVVEAFAGLGLGVGLGFAFGAALGFALGAALGLAGCFFARVEGFFVAGGSDTLGASWDCVLSMLALTAGVFDLDRVVGGSKGRIRRGGSIWLMESGICGMKAGVVAGLGNASCPSRDEPCAVTEDVVPAERCRLSGGGMLKSKAERPSDNDESRKNAGLGNKLERDATRWGS